MADRAEQIRANVLNEIADDYEEISQILKQLDRGASHLKITRDEVKDALAALLTQGWARAYDLWVSDVPLESVPGPDRLDELFFWITPAGLEALKGFPEEWFPVYPDD